jgi:hypothetical protein
MKRKKFMLLGREIGQAKWWYPDGNSCLEVEGFQPAESVSLPPGTLYVDFIKGEINIYGEEGTGKPLQTFDLLKFLASIPHD